MCRYASVLVLLSLCLDSSALAQPPEPPKPGAPAKPAADAAYSFDLIRTRVRFETDGTSRREWTVALRVMDEQAVRAFGQIRLQYQSESEELAIPQIDVQKPDGSVTPTAPSAIQDLAVRPQTAVPIYMDLREKIISVAALRPGDTIRLTAVWSTTKPLAKGHFWFQHSFNDDEIVRDEQLEIDVPAQRTVALKVRTGGAAEERGGAGAVAGDRRVYRWKTSNTTIDKEKQRRPVGADALPDDVRVSSFTDWQDFATWYGPLVAGAPDDRVKAKAAALTAGAKDEAAKIAAIYRFVSTEIRYVSLSFGLGRFAPHSPADVMAHQYGDCKDKAILLKALLEAAGVRSVPVLLNTERSIAEDFASPLEFDHVVALIPGPGQPAAGTWMDATIEVAPLGMLGAPERDKRMLAIDGPARATVITSPADPPFPSVDEVSLDGIVDTIGVLSAAVTITLRGDTEITVRSVVRALPRESLKDFMTGYAAAYDIQGDLSEVTTSDPVATDTPFTLSFRVRKSKYLDWAAGRSQVRTLPSAKVGGASAEERKGLDRIILGSPKTARLRAVVTLPEGYTAEAPTNVTTSKAGVEYAASYRVEGRRLVVDREFRTSAREVPASAFGDYAVLAGIAEKDVAQDFTVRGNVSGTPALPPEATAGELYAAGYSAWGAKRYEAAATLWTRTTEVDPKTADGWTALGLALKELKKYGEAEAAIRKQIALDPNEKRAYRDLGGVLDAAGKDADAAKAYERHVAINPLDGDALKDLGVLYNDLRQYADAAASLEKASGLVKPDAWLFAELGSAHLHLKEVDKARRAFERAIEIAPTVGVRTKVAWELAEAGVDAERAVTLAKQVEKEIADATQQLDVATLQSRHLDYVERLGWCWDALGWVAFRKGQLAEADGYVNAAWHLLGSASIAHRLGQIYEKRDRLADALSFYLTAEALSNAPTAEMRADVRKLSGGGDLTKMLESAKRMAPSDRMIRLKAKAPAGSAQFLVIVDSDREAIDVAFKSGDAALRPLEAALRDEATYPVDFPGDQRVRLPLGIRVTCNAQHGCVGRVSYPSQVTLDK